MRRTFKVLVFDKAGTLNRLTSLFVRRQFNIVNITAGQTLQGGVTEITFVAEVPNNQVLRTIMQQLKKQVNTLSVKDITETNTFNRELLLIKLTHFESETELNRILNNYSDTLNILKQNEDTVYLQAVGPPYTLDELTESLKSFHIESMSRSGTTGIE
ncbi:acetolactate synthase small subunit [Staphylococcus canis]|uniref:Acetolactate synthase small subunit n=1 Tax=Staphylococcus canis TaxID=2724942 RepID=A0ABS0TB68_9STAP|nr:acetolactate synthase small subunit [Staphylococcus canis]MBI5975990.1 acetolactate synthase small subunit [Staphylococcus canis]